MRIHLCNSQYHFVSPRIDLLTILLRLAAAPVNSKFLENDALSNDHSRTSLREFY